MRKKGFTLIELIAVLIILAILALIVTPLVMNIIRKARISADKRSIDAYGRSVELAIANYLLDEGKFPTSIDNLDIEYSGDRVECTTTQLNNDSTVYLVGCTVGGRSVENYTYGSDKSPTYTAYTVGNQVTYNNVDYYVIKDSGAKESTVTLLKAEPLTVDEVNKYGGEHVNSHTVNFSGTAYDINGYGGMSYYTSETCGCVLSSFNSCIVHDDGCKNDYSSSEIKYVVDAWKIAQAPAATEARLISKEEYEEMTIVETIETPTNPREETIPMYDWMYDNNYSYSTNTAYIDSSSDVWCVSEGGILTSCPVIYKYSGGLVVRPVITLKKSALN